MDILLLTASNKTLNIFQIFVTHLANIGKPSQYSILKSVFSVNLVFWFQTDSCIKSANRNGACQIKKV